MASDTSDFVMIPADIQVVGYCVGAAVLLIVLFIWLNPKRLRRAAALPAIEVEGYANELFQYSMNYLGTDVLERPGKQGDSIPLAGYWSKVPWLTAIQRNLVVEELVRYRQCMAYPDHKNFAFILGYVDLGRYTSFRPPPKLVIKDSYWERLKAMEQNKASGNSYNIVAYDSFVNTGTVESYVRNDHGSGNTKGSNNTSIVAVASEKDALLVVLSLLKEAPALEEDERTKAQEFVQTLRDELGAARNESEQERASRGKRMMATLNRILPWLGTIATGMEDTRRIVEQITGATGTQ